MSCFQKGVIMNETDIRKYAGLMEELGLTGLEITEDNKVVRMERTSQGGAQAVLTAEQIQQLLATAQAAAMSGQGMAQGNQQMLPGTAQEQGMAKAVNYGNAGGNSYAAAQTGADYVSVKSPIVGVFYAASAENASPFVSLGDHVEKGKTLCIIEAMKLMNEIYAEESGEIAEICVTNGQVVEYGTELFRIRR